MGIQSTETDDQNQFQAGMKCNICHHLYPSYQTQVFKEWFSMCLNAVDQLSRDDEQVQAAPYIHQKCSHQELLRKVHQLYSGLHLYLQTGMDRQCCSKVILCPCWNMQYQVL